MTKMAQPPLYDDLAAVYDRWLTGDGSAEACLTFYREQMVGDAGPVLELGCGTGRILWAITGLGVPTIGLDLSMAMLRLVHTSRPAVQSLGGGPPIVCAEFQQLPFVDASFSTVALPMRTIGHLVKAEERVAIFSEVYRVLRPNGRFLLDHYHLDDQWARAHDNRFRLMYCGAESENERRVVLIWDRYDYDFDARTLLCTVQLDEIGPAVEAPTSSQVQFPFRWFEPSELVSLGRRAGFHLGFCWGDFAGAPFSDDSDHIVLRLDKQGPTS